MKFHCKNDILPSVDTAVQVFWNILNQNVINFTFLSIILTVQAALQALVSLRFTILENQFD